MSRVLGAERLAYAALASSWLTVIPARAGEGEWTLRGRADVAAYTDSDHVSVLTPSATVAAENPVTAAAVAASYVLDVVSAASVDVVANASPRWTEARHAGGIEGSHGVSLFGAPWKVGASIGGSFEPDYRALGGAGSLSVDLLDKSVTLLARYGYGHDTAGRAGTAFAVFAKDLDRHSVTTAASVVLTKQDLLTIIVDAVLERGDQAKPYRTVPMFRPEVAAAAPVGASLSLVHALRLPERPYEVLPLTRDRYAVTLRWAHRTKPILGTAGITLRLGERMYVDDWSLLASTTDGRIHVDLTPRLALAPFGRLHVQGGAWFHRRAYAVEQGSDGTVVLPALRTGDRELGAMSTVSAGLATTFGLGPAGDPQALRLQIQGTVAHTTFADALLLAERRSALLVVSLEGTWDEGAR